MIPAGSANRSAWANFRSSRSVSGWSARGGLAVNPHALDRSAGGSSSGSAAAVAAGIVPLALGSETDGSILNPASYNGIVGVKPTVGLVDGRGVIPISRAQDTVGPMARTVLDAARLLSVLIDVDYEQVLSGGSVTGMRIGLLEPSYWGQHPGITELTERALRALAESGAGIVEDVEIPGCAELSESGIERTRLLADFRRDLAAYLATRVGPGPRSVAEVIEFNSRHAQQELKYFGQDLMEASVETEGMSSAEYQRVVDDCLRCGRDEGIDAALSVGGVDCLMAAVFDPAPKIDLINGDPGGWTGRRKVSAVQAAAVAGYPGVSVPIGCIGGMPVGMVIFGSADSESSLLAVASCLERALDARVTPRFRMPQAG
jgi:amidase